MDASAELHYLDSAKGLARQVRFFSARIHRDLSQFIYENGKQLI